MIARAGDYRRDAATGRRMVNQGGDDAVGVLGADARIWNLVLTVCLRPTPEALRSLFKVPAIFVFLPERWALPVGRVVLGLGSLALVAFIAMKVLSVVH